MSSPQMVRRVHVCRKVTQLLLFHNLTIKREVYIEYSKTNTIDNRSDLGKGRDRSPCYPYKRLIFDIDYFVKQVKF